MILTDRHRCTSVALSRGRIAWVQPSGAHRSLAKLCLIDPQRSAGTQEQLCRSGNRIGGGRGGKNYGGTGRHPGAAILQEANTVPYLRAGEQRRKRVHLLGRKPR